MGKIYGTRAPAAARCSLSCLLPTSFQRRSTIHRLVLISTTSNRPNLSTDDHKQRVIRAIDVLLPPTEAADAQRELQDFRRHRGHFTADKHCWTYTQEPQRFWEDCEDEGSILAKLASRLMLTIANSVPAERAFSTMNFTKSKLRNRLSAERTALLCFIFINCRVLEREDRTILALTDDELDQMEEDLAVLAEDESSEEEEDTVLQSRAVAGQLPAQSIQSVGVLWALGHSGGSNSAIAGQKRPASQDLGAQFVHWAPPEHR